MQISVVSDRKVIVVASPYTSPTFADMVFDRKRGPIKEQIKECVEETLKEWGQDIRGTKRNVWWNKTEYEILVREDYGNGRGIHKATVTGPDNYAGH